MQRTWRSHEGAITVGGMKTRTLLAAGALAGVATIASVAAATPAGAARFRPVIEMGSTTAGFAVVDGAAIVTGEMDGRPYRGTYTATLTADDGSLPAPGDCEPATAVFHLDARVGRYLDVTATGDVCGEFVQLPYITTHAFVGRYDVTGSTKQNVLGTDGWFEIRLGDDGSASTFLVDT